MNKLQALLATLSLVAITANEATAKTIDYTIQSGDSLFTIARKNHTSIQDIQKANNLKKGEVLKLGRVLKVPSGNYFGHKDNSTAKQTDVSKLAVKKAEKTVVSAAKPSSQTSSVYKVKKGDILSSIAKKHGTSVKALQSLNGLKGSALKIGQALKIPGQKTETPILASTKSAVPVKTTAVYKVKKGDILSSIAKKYKTNVKTLQSLNGLKGSSLKIGQALKVPSKQQEIHFVQKKVSSKKLANAISKLPSVAINKTKSVKPFKTKEKFSFAKLGEVFYSKDHDDEDITKPKSGIVNYAKTKLGQKYVWGSCGQGGTFDCSGFTRYVYEKNGINLPRRSIDQAKYGKFVKRSELKKGDLIFFDTSKNHRGYVNHVGIYVGDNKFIHASSAKRKVVITSLDKTFYSMRYMGARRPS